MQGEIRRVAGVADSATDGMELPPQRAKTGPAGDPGLAARRRWVEENPLKPKPGLKGATRAAKRGHCISTAIRKTRRPA